MGIFDLEKEALTEIIDKDRIIKESLEEDEDINKILKNLAEEICKNQKIVINEIKEEVKREKSLPSAGDIVTILIEENKAEQYCDKKNPDKTTFMKMADYSGTCVFLNAPYEKIQDIVGDTRKESVKYKGLAKTEHGELPIVYHFRFLPIYLEAEKALIDFRKFDNNFSPIIYSPYSHKSFEIIIETEYDCKIEGIDYQFKENGLADIVKIDMSLFWNVISDTTGIMEPAAQKPYRDFVIYKYLFEKKERPTFIIPLGDDADIFEISEDRDSVSIWANKEICDFKRVYVREVDKNRPGIKELISADRIFENSLKPGFGTVSRVRTHADIRHVFSMFFDGKHNVALAEDNITNAIKRYRYKYKSYLPDRLPVKNVPEIRARFTGEDRFLCDYANYVLLYLEFHYPEIEWVGVK